MAIQFIDLAAQQERIRSEIDAGIANVLAHGRYVFGQEITELETKLAAFSAAKHAIACANGTDALVLAMMAMGVGPGDAVFCPSFTFCATAESVALLGATPVLVDIDRQTYNLCPESLRQAIADIKQDGALTPKTVIAVDLFGQTANYPAISEITKAENLFLIADSAQGFGSTLDGNHPSHWADYVTVSFFPAKPLGCYGDGGAILTNSDEAAEILKSLRMHGAGDDRYDNVRIGTNSRLDSIQAAILLPKLAIFQDEIESRNKVAARYNAALDGRVSRVPYVMDGGVSIWAQYTIEVMDPIATCKALGEKGVPTARYYPKAIHMQQAYKDYPIVSTGLGNTEDACKYVMSLPMHPYLDEATQDIIVQALLAN